jgi:hypothetical protein
MSEVAITTGGAVRTTTDAAIAKTTEERKALLDSALHLFGAKGFRIENRSDFQATVSKGKETRHILHLVLSVLTFGVWLPIWAVLWLGMGMRRRLVSVDEYGNTVEQKLTTL